MNEHPPEFLEWVVFRRSLAVPPLDAVYEFRLDLADPEAERVEAQREEEIAWEELLAVPA